MLTEKRFLLRTTRKAWTRADREVNTEPGWSPSAHSAPAHQLGLELCEVNSLT